MNLLIAAPIVTPLVGAALTVAVRRLAFQRAVSLVALVTSLAASIGLLVKVIADEAIVVSHLGGWPSGIAISLVADHLAAVMTVVSLAVVTIVLVFAIGQRAVDERSPVYHPVYLVLSAGISQAFLAGDLFNMFVAFELLLMASYVLMTLEGTANQIRSGTTYVVMNVIESMILLTAVGLVFAATGTVSMAELSVRLAELPDGVRTGLNLLLLVAFGMKAAVFPLYFWLPDSYPTAPSSVTAVFGGLLTKVGVYGLIRTETLLFPGNQSHLIMAVAAITMLVGVFGAISHTQMKRLLSFHIVSQIGYIVMGIGLGTRAALAASVFYLLHIIPVKTSLFLVEGIVEKETGASSFDEVSGLARRSGFFALVFLVPALSLAGLPPFSGFFAKFLMVREGLDQAQWALVAAAVAASILTLVSMTKIWVSIFWGEVYPTPPEGRTGILRHHRSMAGSTIVLIVLTVAIAFCAGPIYSFCLDAADLLLDPANYLRQVRGS